ncbi:ankyrin repeat-containing domain protein [Aspergillus carlsbadensis]|nr:ankyrin repeat-containing domain protein [Aspergillus carlsbadensis]
MGKHAPRIPESEWEKQKKWIVSLYLEPQSTLEHTMVLMKERHGFEATKNQYRTKLKLWRVAKNATSDVWIWVDRQIKYRGSNGKSTDVFLHGKRLPRKKVLKEIARNVTFTDSLTNRDVPTPEGITVATPAGEEARRSEGLERAQSLPWLQLLDEVLDIVTDILDSAAGNDGDHNERGLRYFPALNVPGDIVDQEMEKCLSLWPDECGFETSLHSRMSRPRITHATRQAVKRMAMLLFLATNNQVSWRVLYSSLQPFIQHWTHEFLEFIFRSTAVSTRILRRLILYGAVEAGDIPVAQKVIDSGIKLTSHDGLMTLAFVGRNRKLVELLGKKGVPLEISEYPPDIFDREEDIILLRCLLEAGAEPERVIDDEVTGFPLILAAERGSLDAVELLLQHGARVDFYDPRKHGSALHAATACGHCAIVKRLLHSGSRADINVPSNPKYQGLLHKILQDPHCDVALAMQRAAQTPIQIAAANDDLEMAGLLQSHGAYLNSQSTVFRHKRLLENAPPETGLEEYGALTALQYAVANENPQLVWFLLCCGAFPDLQGHPFSDTPLQMSARLGNEQLVRMLLDAGATVNAPAQGFNGRTALQAAAESGNLNIAQLLVECGADVNATGANNRGLTAIQAAALQGHGPMFELLLAKGAHINAPPADKEGLTALQAAVMGGHEYIMTRLISLGADIDSMASPGGRTALQAVIRHRNHSMLRTLVAHGANINASPSESSGTALQEASKYRWLHGAEFLLSLGADVNARPHHAASAGNDLTALGWAIQNEDFDMTEMLLRKGADPLCAQDGAGSSPTALSFALHNGKSTDIIELLLRSDDMSTLVAAIRGRYSTASVYKMLLDKMTQIESQPDFFIQRACQRAWNEIIISDYLSPSEQTAQIEVMDLLLEKGAEINALYPGKGVNCLQVALDRGCRQIAKFLLQRGASPDKPAIFDMATPLQEAIDRWYFDIIDMILETDVNVNATPAFQNGRTALQMAARDGLFGVTVQLLELGADVAAPPAMGGRTAIDGAAENGRIDMVQLLLDAYKGNEAIGDVCERAAGCAEKRGHIEIAEWLREYSS